MLYPKDNVKKEENVFKQKLEYIKQNVIIVIQAFRNYNSFVLFIEQKFHF